MCTSSETSDTTKSIITVAPSTIVPTLNSTPPLCHQVQVRTTASVPWWAPSSAAASTTPATWSASTGLGLSTRSIQARPARQESTNVAATATMPSSEPFFGRRLPKKRISRNDAAGMAGMIQAFSRKNISSPLHQVEFVEVDARAVAVDQQHEGQAHPDLGRRHGDDEEAEHVAGDGAGDDAEGDEV